MKVERKRETSKTEAEKGSKRGKRKTKKKMEGQINKWIEWLTYRYLPSLIQSVTRPNSGEA